MNMFCVICACNENWSYTSVGRSFTGRVQNFETQEVYSTISINVAQEFENWFSVSDLTAKLTRTELLLSNTVIKYFTMTFGNKVI